MIEEFETDQKIVCRILNNAVEKNIISHAYLFETNGYKDKYKLALAFAKMLLCPYNYHNNIKCGKCTQCQNIDKNNFSELKIISPDGLWIKKEQLEELQKEFSTSGIQSNKRVYIIEQANRLNKQSANSILKFLEEPENNIIAILITDNAYQMLNTIISRCQIISFTKNKNDLENLQEKIKNSILVNVDDEKLLEIIKNVVDYINYYEKNGLDTILKNQKLWHNNFKEKQDIILAINIAILFYKDIINIKLKEKIEYFVEYKNDLEKISYINNIKQLNKKIKILIETKKKIDYNINANLLIDKLVLDLERCD